jgi:hypothetical protein
MFTPALDKAVELIAPKFPELREQGWSGFFMPVLGSFRAIAIHPGTPGKEYSISEAHATWKPILEGIEDIHGMGRFQSKPYIFKNYKEFFDKSYGAMEEMGMGKETTKAQMRKRHGPGEGSIPPVNRGIAPMDSHMLSVRHLRSPNITEAFTSFRGTCAILLVTPGMKHGDGKQTSANPSWREAIVHVTGMKIPLAVSADSLRKFAPHVGAYANEVSFRSRLWSPTEIIQAYYGNLTGNDRFGAKTIRASPNSRPNSIPI